MIWWFCPHEFILPLGHNFYLGIVWYHWFNDNSQSYVDYIYFLHSNHQNMNFSMCRQHRQHTVFFWRHSASIIFISVGLCYGLTAIQHQAITLANPLQWRHNDHDSVSNHQPRGCLLNRLFRRRSKKISKLRITGLCVKKSPGPVNSLHKGPVTRKMFVWRHHALQ